MQIKYSSRCNAITGMRQVVPFSMTISMPGCVYYSVHSRFKNGTNGYFRKAIEIDTNPIKFK